MRKIEKKTRAVYLILLLGIWTGFLVSMLRNMALSDLLSTKKAITTIGLVYILLFFYGWVLTEKEEECESKDWIDSTPLFRRDDMPMYYAEEESEEERVKKVK
ncbi:MAG: hypothetical protein ACE5I5_16285 [Candidatus Heimdallarchaeota archaeon]